MKRPTIITIDGTEHEIRHIDGRAYRVVSEFENNLPKFGDTDFIERHAALIAEFYSGLTSDDVLVLPLEEIAPASLEIRNFIFNRVWDKTKAIEKNAPKDKATEQ